MYTAGVPVPSTYHEHPHQLPHPPPQCISPGLANRFLFLAQLWPLSTAAWRIVLRRISSLAGKRWCDLLAMSVLSKALGEALSLSLSSLILLSIFLLAPQDHCHYRIPSQFWSIHADLHILIPSETCQHASAPSLWPEAGCPTPWHVPGFPMHCTLRPSPASWYLSCRRPILQC